MARLSGITLLGTSGVTKAPSRLEKFPRPKLLTSVVLSCDEMTSTCPVTRQPDQYTVVIRYSPDKFCVESKAMKLEIQKYRNRGAFGEKLSALLAWKIAQSVDPFDVEVTTTQKPRGGISVIATSAWYRIPSTSGIYQIANLETGRVYVGSAVNMKDRWYYHQNDLKKGTHANKDLQKDWNQYGEEAFAIFVVELTEVSHLSERETYWMQKKGALDPEKGYNRCPFPHQGTRGLRWNHTEETKKKIAAAQRGKKRSDVTRMAIAIGTKRAWANPDLRKKMSEIAKKSAKNRKRPAKPRSQESRDKMSKAMKAVRAKKKWRSR